MRHLLDVKNNRIVSATDGEMQVIEQLEGVRLSDVGVSFEGGVATLEFIMQAYLDYENIQPNRFSLARRLEKYERKNKIQKHG